MCWQWWGGSPRLLSHTSNQLLVRLRRWAQPVTLAGTPYAARASQALNDWRCLVYWLLLPVEANAQRHLLNETGPSNTYWSRLWAWLQRVFGGAGSPRDHARSGPC